jgi:hypothetical protein
LILMPVLLSSAMVLTAGCGGSAGAENRKLTIATTVGDRTGWINGLAAGSLDDQDVIIAGIDGSVFIWDHHGQPVEVLTDDIGSVDAVAVGKAR